MDHFDYKNGDYFAEDVQLDRLAREIGTPFYCYSSATLTRHYEVFRDSFAGIDAKICYAVKANSNLAVLATLARLGSGVDVVSEGEIRVSLAAGIVPRDIVFSGVGKTREEMAFALNQDIFQFNIESEPELLLLNDVALSEKRRAPVAIRINPDVDPKTHVKISTGQKETKFGIPARDAGHVYEMARTLPGIQVQGISMHIGSQLTQLEPFAKAFAQIRELVGMLRAEGHTLRTIDLGGGLGIPYGKETPPVPAAYGQIVRKVMKGLDCQLVLEPGRLLVGNAGILVTRVIYVKRSGTRIFIIVDAGMNDLLRPSLYDAYHEIVPVKQQPNAKGELMDIVGPVCETGDIFAEQRLLPLPQPGDLLAIRSAGAYGAVMASNYNGRPLIPEIMVKGKQYAIVRPRQTYEQMLSRDIIPAWIKE